MLPISPLFPLILALFCGSFFIWRFVQVQRNYLFIGRALGYFLLSAYYVWALANADSPDMAFWARWANTIFLLTQFIYFVEEWLLMRRA